MAQAITGKPLAGAAQRRQQRFDLFPVSRPVATRPPAPDRPVGGRFQRPDAAGVTVDASKGHRGGAS